MEVKAGQGRECRGELASRCYPFTRRDTGGTVYRRTSLHLAHHLYFMESLVVLFSYLSSVLLSLKNYATEHDEFTKHNGGHCRHRMLISCGSFVVR